MKYSTTIAVDLAKSVFEIAVSDVPGHALERHRLSRSRFEAFFAQHHPAAVVFEACSSSHHRARSLGRLGHSVVLLPPHAVRPYIVRNKAILPVPVKSPDQCKIHWDLSFSILSKQPISWKTQPYTAPLLMVNGRDRL